MRARKASVILLLLFLAFECNAQDQRDSSNKNEVSINLLPLVGLSVGAMPVSTSFLSVDFSRKISSKNFFNIGIGVLPFQRYSYNYFPSYHSTVGDKNVFHNFIYSPTPKLLLSLGGERRISSRRFEHGLGGAVFLTYQSINIFSDYIWAPNGEAPNSHFLRGDTASHKVDSLGYKERQKNTGIGLHVYYSLRLHLNKRFSILIQGGPNCSFILSERRNEDFKTKNIRTYRHNFLEPFTLPLISRFSLAFRF